MLCFELDPPEHLQCREFHHQTPSSYFCPCLTPSQGSLSTAAAALWHCQEKGIHGGWELPGDSHCSRCVCCSKGCRNSPARQCCSPHTVVPAQCASTHQGTPSSGNNWGSQLTGDEDELAGPGNGTAGALSPITAHLTARLLSARTGVQTVVCKERHAEGWRGRRLRCSLLVM